MLKQGGGEEEKVTGGFVPVARQENRNEYQMEKRSFRTSEGRNSNEGKCLTNRAA